MGVFNSMQVQLDLQNEKYINALIHFFPSIGIQRITPGLDFEGPQKIGDLEDYLRLAKEQGSDSIELQSKPFFMSLSLRQLFQEIPTQEFDEEAQQRMNEYSQPLLSYLRGIDNGYDLGHPPLILPPILKRDLYKVLSIVNSVKPIKIMDLIEENIIILSCQYKLVTLFYNPNQCKIVTGPSNLGFDLDEGFYTGRYTLFEPKTIEYLNKLYGQWKERGMNVVDPIIPFVGAEMDRALQGEQLRLFARREALELKDAVSPAPQMQ